MKCDSVHKKIEVRCRNRDIYLPSAYASEIRLARKNSFPYRVIQADHDFLSDFSDLKYFPDYHPASRKGHPIVNEVVAYKYTPGMLVDYKLCHGDEWEVLQKKKQ
jgi:hypothetical protein